MIFVSASQLHVYSPCLLTINRFFNVKVLVGASVIVYLRGCLFEALLHTLTIQGELHRRVGQRGAGGQRHHQLPRRGGVPRRVQVPRAACRVTCDT